MQRYLIPTNNIFFHLMKRVVWEACWCSVITSVRPTSHYMPIFLYVAHTTQKTSFSIIRLNLFYYSIEKLRVSQREYWKQRRGKKFSFEGPIALMKMLIRHWAPSRTQVCMPWYSSSNFLPSSLSPWYSQNHNNSIIRVNPCECMKNC